MTHTVYALFTEDGLDQETYTRSSATREAKDLRKMGCRVSVYMLKAPYGPRIDDALSCMTDRVRDMKTLTGPWLAKLAEQHGLTISKTKD